jgi:hypothetical protein
MKRKPFRRSLGLLMIVDSTRAFFSPVEYPRSFQFGNPLIDDILDYFAENPVLTRRFAAVEFAIGLWLIMR